MAYVGPFNMIIPEGVLKNGSDVFNILDPDTGGAKTFSVQLSADGSAPATYWGARSHLLSDVHNALTNMTITQFKAFVDQKAAELGRTPVGSITAFKNALLIDGGADFWGFAAASGLVAVVPDEPI
ncbi:MAG: hypothetical protein EOS04_24260 [Mesorhizobium sp.]|nr:MAG: hypothetical protein EOR98_26600 [Mesorhizobium sp.]RWN73187.1 MAG: hypothetical protein EOS01_26955 [Mesorhizobium sp.]RWN85159.1 MAG: hypothetical protein EOS04_24260 [Mesorhizobium sp.]